MLNEHLADMALTYFDRVGVSLAEDQSPAGAVLDRMAWQYGERMRLRMKPESGVTRRACLTCGSDFHSTGAGNRICPACRASDTAEDY